MTNENKTILSWDVGIKNLAFCVIEKNIATDDFKILKWGVINLNDDQQKCQFELRTGSVCQDAAKYCVYHKDKIQLFKENAISFACSKHKDKMIPECKKIEDTFPKVKKTKKTENIQSNNIYPKCCICENNSTMILTDTNYCWCDEHYQKKGLSFVKKVASKKISSQTCSKQPIQSLAEKLFEKLDVEFKNFGEISEVLIENQPTLKNPKMKTISSILYSYFIVRGIIDNNLTKSKITEVKFVSPSNKLKVNSKNTNTLLKTEKDKDNSNVYKMTKNLGVKYCKALINSNDNEILDKVKKKDDMCDAFLQGFQYLFTPVPEKHFLKLKTIGFEVDDKSKSSKKTKPSKDLSVSSNDE